MKTPATKAVLSVACTAMLAVCAVRAAADSKAVVVNGVRLADAAVAALEHGYRTSIPAGRYWYDIRSGLWGREGGPAAGRIEPGFDFGARLREDASDGDTWVIVNGRRIAAVELTMLQGLVGPVLPGRYWLDAYGNAGFEGGPALVNLIAAHRRSPGSRGGWNRNTTDGNWGGDGTCSYYSHPDGPSVMIGAC